MPVSVQTLLGIRNRRPTIPSINPVLPNLELFERQHVYLQWVVSVSKQADNPRHNPFPYYPVSKLSRGFHDSESPGRMRDY
eukprot:1348238-Amorphochlora_amoeboformis.AAC.1